MTDFDGLVALVTGGASGIGGGDRLLEAADDPGAAAEALRRRQPLGRLVTAEEVARAIASLAGPLAASTAGAVLRGGRWDDRPASLSRKPESIRSAARQRRRG